MNYTDNISGPSDTYDSSVYGSHSGEYLLPHGSKGKKKSSCCNAPKKERAVPLPESAIKRPGLKQYIAIPLAFVVLIIGGAVPFGSPVTAAQKCLAILLFATVLWASDAIPLFVTSLLIPACVVFMGVLRDQTTLDPMSAPDAASEITHEMLSGTILMCLAGFSMAAALKRQGLDQRIAGAVLRRAATKGISAFLAVLMALGLGLSAFITNVTAPALLLSFVQPYLDALPPGSRTASAIIFAVMTSCNLGGMTTPIASPQNMVAIQEASKQDVDIGINFGTFTLMGIICAVLCGAGGWVYLRFIYLGKRAEKLPALDPSELPQGPKSDHHKKVTITKDELSAIKSSDLSQDDEANPAIKDGSPLPPMEGNLDASSNVVAPRPSILLPKAPEADRASMITVIILSCVAIVSWIAVDFVKKYVGDNGIISLCVICLFYGTGALRIDDLRTQIPWHVLLLLMGGNALGHAVRSSGLLEVITDVLEALYEWPSYVIIILLLLIIAVVSTFISHTVAAIILTPIVLTFILTSHGTGIDVSPGGTVVSVIFVISGAMGLPVTSVPNITASGARTSRGNQVVTTSQVLQVGNIMTVINYVIITGVVFWIGTGVLGEAKPW